MLVVNTSIFSIFQEEAFGVSVVLIPSQNLLYNQIFLSSDARSLALLYIKTPCISIPYESTLVHTHSVPLVFLT